MWLIDVENYGLKYVLRRDVWKEHPYAILSHTWENDEVTFQDMKNIELARKKKGFRKIKRTCKQAKKDNLEYAWVDTCCIDKTSSAELQEAINSMFEWYGRSEACYAYLSDVNHENDEGDSLSQKLSESRWFSRGWTLQELIAPSYVMFYDAQWRPLGTRSALAKDILSRTKIDIAMLQAGHLYEFEPNLEQFDDMLYRRSKFVKVGQRWLGNYSVAQRMSWAAGRKTTRAEDRAYSLFGIFGVTMPLLYGEGRRAFTRLQEEILRVNREPDLSVLLWEKSDTSEADQGRDDEIQALLALSPDNFQNCGSIRFHRTAQQTADAVEIVVSSVGIRARLHVLPVTKIHEGANYAALLNCYDEADVASTIALKLKGRNSLTLGGYDQEREAEVLNAVPYSLYDLAEYQTARRTMPIDIIEAQSSARSRVVFMQREEDKAEFRGVDEYQPQCVWLRLARCGPLVGGWKVIDAFPRDLWDTSQLTFNTAGNPSSGWKSSGLTGSICFQRSDAQTSRVVLTFTANLLCRVDVVDYDAVINQDTLMGYCVKLAASDKDGKRFWANGRGETDGSCLFGTQWVKLYDGAGTYDGAAFVVKPEVRIAMGRLLRILQCQYVTLYRDRGYERELTESFRMM